MLNKQWRLHPFHGTMWCHPRADDPRFVIEVSSNDHVKVADDPRIHSFENPPSWSSALATLFSLHAATDHDGVGCPSLPVMIASLLWHHVMPSNGRRFTVCNWSSLQRSCQSRDDLRICSLESSNLPPQSLFHSSYIFLLQSTTDIVDSVVWYCEHTLNKYSRYCWLQIKWQEGYIRALTYLAFVALYRLLLWSK